LEITDHAGFEVRIPRSKPADLGVPTDLDPGETEAIVLALEMHADLVLMDERKGTEAARRLGLATIGVFGVLLVRRGAIRRGGSSSIHEPSRQAKPAREPLSRSAVRHNA
jgi:predicted nucleic acid-binding protein